jgi:hypothetical protein
MAARDELRYSSSTCINFDNNNDKLNNIYLHNVSTEQQQQHNNNANNTMNGSFFMQNLQQSQFDYQHSSEKTTINSNPSSPSHSSSIPSPLSNSSGHMHQLSN